MIALKNHNAPLGVVGRTVREATTADGKTSKNDHPSQGAKDFRR
jgi:hypothetical protein